MNKNVHKSKRFLILALVCIVIMLVAGSATAGPGNWWDVEPEPEEPSCCYDSILYSEIAPKLREIELNSNRVKVEVIGQSAGGRNLFLVTLSDPQGDGAPGPISGHPQHHAQGSRKSAGDDRQVRRFQGPRFHQRQHPRQRNIRVLTRPSA